MTRFVSTYFQLPAICHENAHLFLSAAIASVTELYFCYYYGAIPDVLRYEYITLFSVFLIFSIPFTILDPPIWFCIFMTSFSHALYFKGFYSLALVNICIMFAGLCSKYVVRETERAETLLSTKTDPECEFV